MHHYIETKNRDNQLVRRIDVTKASTKQIIRLKRYLWKMFPNAFTYNLLSDEELDSHYEETA